MEIYIGQAVEIMFLVTALMPRKMIPFMMTACLEIDLLQKQGSSQISDLQPWSSREGAH